MAGTAPGAAVLLRALEPETGLDVMRARRGLEDARRLCAGPGRLCQALGVTRAQDGLDATAAPFALLPALVAGEVALGPRIGLSKGLDTAWRFGLRGSPYLSRPFR